VSATREDVDYILEAVNCAFPRAQVTAADVISTYAGLRPLVAPEDEMQESDISREDEIFESPAGLISLGGGKLTTHRHVAERIVDVIARRIGRRPGRCRTARVPLPGGRGINPGPVADAPPVGSEDHLRRRYGALASEVAQLVRGDASLASPIVGDLPDLRAEIAWAVEHEMALKIEDVLTRRLHIRLRSRSHGDTVVREVARMMGERLGWDADRVEAEVAEYNRALQHHANGSHKGLGNASNGTDGRAQVTDTTPFSGESTEKAH
jgi:glycerol-3-phosphate dehydrogenase